MTTFLDELTPISDVKIRLPSDLNFSKKEIHRRLCLIESFLSTSTDKMALSDIAKLLNCQEKDLKSLLRNRAFLLKLFYKIPLTDSGKSAGLFMDFRMRDNPLAFLTLVLGILRFTGACTDVLSIDKYRLKHTSEKKQTKLILPNSVRESNPILKSVTRGCIDYYPDIVYYLAVNHIAQEEPLTRGKALVPPIITVLLALFPRVERLVAMREEDNKRFAGAKDEKAVFERDKEKLLSKSDYPKTTFRKSKDDTHSGPNYQTHTG